MFQKGGWVAAGIVLLAACGGGEQPAQTTNPGGKRVDTAIAGKVAGRVLFDGPAPQNSRVKMEADPFCQRAHPDGTTFETYLVNDGGLDNVFVYVKDGLSDYAFDIPKEPVKLDQQGCKYFPHVFGVRAGQPVEIGSSDATVHNVHALARSNSEFNFGLDIPGTKQTRTFKNPEVFVTFKCDVHNWMTAYAGVVAHPYFAVTANGGAFELKDLPPGTYTIEAVHEKLGAQTSQVTIGEKESKDVGFTFKAQPAGT